MKNFLTKTPVVITLALICCALWGSAFPCIKIGYQMFSIGGNDTASQILFAGIRFLLAGLMVILICSFIYKKPLIPHNGTTVKRIFILSLFQTSFWRFLYRVCYLKWKRLHPKRCLDV